MTIGGKQSFSSVMDNDRVVYLGLVGAKKQVQPGSEVLLQQST